MSKVKDVTFSLKVMINKEKSKVLFAEVDSDLADILISFLTLPLGRIVKILEKHYGDKAPTFGSISSLYKGLANLDHNVHFWTEGAKLILLHPISSFESEYKALKLNITDSQPAEYFFCEEDGHNSFWSASMYYDHIDSCKYCWGAIGTMKTGLAEKEAQAAVCYEGVFTKNTLSFIISDDLQVVSNMTGLLQTISILGIADTCKAELMNVTFGFNEIMDLLKASLISPTPLSDIILGKTSHMNAAEFALSNKACEVATSNAKKMSLKIVVQKPTNKVLFAQAKEDFVEFLFSFLTIPLGGVECLLANKASIRSIDNLYRSVADLKANECFKTTNTRNRLIKPKLPHGYISKDHFFPLTEEALPRYFFQNISLFSSVKFPKGQGRYLKGPRMYKVTDDLTVTPFCVASILSSLNKLKIPICDVEEREVKIGLEEGLSILKASLTSTSALTNGLGMTNPKLKKQPKQEK